MKRTSSADLTLRQPQVGGGMNQDRLFLCGHKSSTTGAYLRGTVAVRCASCQATIRALRAAHG